MQVETVPATQARSDARADVTSDLADLDAQARNSMDMGAAFNAATPGP